MNGILNVEAIRIAQDKFGHRTLTGDEVRWGLEHLKLDPARVEALGAKGLFHSIDVTWNNHEGVMAWSRSSSGTGPSGRSCPTGSRPIGPCCGPIIEKSAAAHAARSTTSRRARRPMRIA